MFGTELRGWLTRLPIVIIAVAATSLGLVYVFPSAPTAITIAASNKGTSIYFNGEAYREHLARHGINVEVRETPGTEENLALLSDPNSGVQVAFKQGGVSIQDEFPELLSLGRVWHSPMWVF